MWPIMPNVARVGDKVSMNCPHGGVGTIISGSSNITVNDRALAREGDIVQCDDCGKTRPIDFGSPNVFGNDPAVARVGDTSTGVCDPGFKCCPHVSTGTISTGSDNTVCNGG